jgi:molybdate transport system substrate-binding protein
MLSRMLSAFTLAAALALAAAPTPASADLVIYSGGAVQAGLSDTARLYEKARATKVSVTFMPMGPLTARLAEGLTADIVILTREHMEKAVAAGKVDKETVTDVGRTAIGVAVGANAPAPDISTAEAFKQALLNAKSIVYIDPARGTSGAHVAKLLDRLGIAEAVKAKTTLGEGGYIVAPVGRGEVELGIHQITEILPVPGVKLVGPLPAELQSETVYQGAVLAGAAGKDTARDFLVYVRSAEIRKLFADKGFIETK